MEKKIENHEMMKKIENPPNQSVRTPRVKFQKACELRVISGEACEDRVKFRNISKRRGRDKVGLTVFTGEVDRAPHVRSLQLVVAHVRQIRNPLPIHI
jgi:hypothetical protein